MSAIKLLESIRIQGISDLYASVFEDGTEVVFRLPPVKVAARMAFILSLTPERSLQYLIHNYIFSNYVIDEHLAKFDNDIPAGIISSVAMMILSLSGLGETESVEEKLNRARSNVDLHSSMKMWIMVAFGGYTAEKLDSLNYQELLGLFVLAEQSLLQRGIIEEPLSIKKPDEKQRVSLAQQISADADEYQKFEKDAAPRQRNVKLEQQSRAREQAFYERMRRQQQGG